MAGSQVDGKTAGRTEHGQCGRGVKTAAERRVDPHSVPPFHVHRFSCLNLQLTLLSSYYRACFLILVVYQFFFLVIDFLCFPPTGLCYDARYICRVQLIHGAWIFTRPAGTSGLYSHTCFRFVPESDTKKPATGLVLLLNGLTAVGFRLRKHFLGGRTVRRSRSFAQFEPVHEKAIRDHG